jgi:hypothetical protein
MPPVALLVILHSASQLLGKVIFEKKVHCTDHLGVRLATSQIFYSPSERP